MPSIGYGPLRALGETQLQIQFALLGTYDARAIGALAVDSALAAVATATADPIGRFWWLSLFGLLVAALPCVFVLSSGDGWMATRAVYDIDQASEDGVALMDRILVASIARAVDANEQILQRKQMLVSAASLLTGMTIVSVIVGILVG
jgi:hypothetical protein